MSITREEVKAILDRIGGPPPTIEPSWFCHLRRQEHEVGCPHRDWSPSMLQDALLTKKQWDQRNFENVRDLYRLIAELLLILPGK